MEKKVKASSEKLAELVQNLSNPKELINYTCKMTCNLGRAWDAGDFYQKQMFQNPLFPSGLGYDAKIDHYRITEINLVFSYIADLSKDLAENKNGTSQNFDEKSRLVPYGLQISNFLDDFQAIRTLMNTLPRIP